MSVSLINNAVLYSLLLLCPLVVIFRSAIIGRESSLICRANAMGDIGSEGPYRMIGWRMARTMDGKKEKTYERTKGGRPNVEQDRPPCHPCSSVPTEYWLPRSASSRDS